METIEYQILSNFLCDDIITHCLLKYIYSTTTTVFKNGFGNFLVQICDTRFDQKYGNCKEWAYSFLDEGIDYTDLDYDDDPETLPLFNIDSTMDELNEQLSLVEDEDLQTTPTLMTECFYTLTKDCESVLHGTFKQYDRENGQLTKLIEYKESVEHGKKYIYSDGRIEIESYYLEGQLHGPYKKYKGVDLIQDCSYFEGKLHGTYKEYLHDREDKIVPYIHCTYKHGEYDGLCETNFKYIDSPYTKINYKDGKRHGSFQKYYDPTAYNVTSGHKLHCETNYQDGQLHGLHTEYLKNGDLYKVIDYVDGKIHGKYREYKDGVLYLECDHVNGRKHGYLIDHLQMSRGKFIHDVHIPE